MKMSRGFEKSKFKIIFNHRAQATIEAVLLMIVLIGAFTLATDKIREKQWLQNFTKKAVDNVKNMSEYGTWKGACKAPGSGKTSPSNCHPNSINRSLSSAPN